MAKRWLHTPDGSAAARRGPQAVRSRRRTRRGVPAFADRGGRGAAGRPVPVASRPVTPSGSRRRRQNVRLKKLLNEAELEGDAQGARRGKLLTPNRRRAAVEMLRAQFGSRNGERAGWLVSAARPSGSRRRPPVMTSSDKLLEAKSSIEDWRIDYRAPTPPTPQRPRRSHPPASSPKLDPRYQPALA
jgi:hypothetical protein